MDQLRAERMRLSYHPDESYQLVAPPAIRDLIERERRDRPTTLNELFDAQGHY